MNYEAAWCVGERLFAAASSSPERPAFHFKQSDHPEVATALRTAARHNLNVTSIAPLCSSSWDESIFKGVLHMLQRIGSPLTELELPKAGNESLALLVPVASQLARVVAKRLTLLSVAALLALAKQHAAGTRVLIEQECFVTLCVNERLELLQRLKRINSRFRPEFGKQLCFQCRSLGSALGKSCNECAPFSCRERLD